MKENSNKEVADKMLKLMGSPEKAGESLMSMGWVKEATEILLSIGYDEETLNNMKLEAYKKQVIQLFETVDSHEEAVEEASYKPWAWDKEAMDVLLSTEFDKEKIKRDDSEACKKEAAWLFEIMESPEEALKAILYMGWDEYAMDVILSKGYDEETINRVRSELDLQPYV